ncbi:uncharacterized protein C8orf48 homolog isoform 3-T3 [Pluvialis apricaria]
MTSTSADSSGDCGKRQAELSQSYSSSGLDYSEDTFEPFSEEEEACWQRESEPSESYRSTEDLELSAVSDALESMSWLAGQNDAEITELLDGEVDALRSFCTIKISKMRQQLISKQENGDKSRKLQHGFTGKKLETSDLNYIVPDRLINRIRLKNIRETVKQVTEAQIHESSVCPDCQKKKGELAKIAFLRRAKILMESALIQEKLEEQIYSNDVLARIGEALGSFPKPSEDPRNLWQRLKGKLQQLPPFLRRLPGSPARRCWSWALLQRAAFWHGTTGKGSKLVATNSTFPSLYLTSTITSIY